MTLETLGLTTTAEQVYRLLLSNQQQSAGEIAVALEINAKALEAAIDLLKSLDLVTIEGVRISVTPPSVGTQNLLIRQEDTISRLKQRYEDSQDAVRIFLAEQVTNNQLYSSEKIVGRHEINHRLSLLPNEILVSSKTFSPGDSHTQASLTSSRELTIEMIRRGVESKSIYSTSALRSATAKEHFGWLVSNGAEVRTAPHLPPRMIICDNKVAILPISMVDGYAGITIERGEVLIKALVALFDKYWADATPYGEPTQPGELNEIERGILELLAEGATDKIIMNKMHLSDRAIRRTVNNLKDRLGARSRFELGIKAGHAGWL